jgi:chromosome segregation ATPase
MLRLELEAFRGFGAKQIIDLDADTVLVQGDNGTGKTSITDGLLWLFTGEITRLKERAKGIRKDGADPVVNRYREDMDAVVKLAVRVDGIQGDSGDGIEMEFERAGTGRISTLSVRHHEETVEGEGAEQLLAEVFGDFTSAQFSQAVNSWGILQQHALLSALEGGASMHERLAEMVGLERVNHFAKGASEAVKTLKAQQKEVEAVRDRLHARRDGAESSLKAWRIEQSPPESEGVRISRLIARCVRQLPEGLSLKNPVDELEKVGAFSREVADMAEIARVRGSAVAAVKTVLGEREMSSQEIEGKLEELKVEADRAIARAPMQVQMADAAIRLLASECPVCGQSIDEHSVRQHLEEVLASAEAESRRASELRQRLAELEVQLQSVRIADAKREEAEGGLSDSAKILQSHVRAANWIEVDSDWLDEERADVLVEVLASLSTRVREAQAEARRTGHERIVRWSSEVDAVAGEIGKADAELSAAKARTDRGVALDKASHRAAERIVERALKQLQPSLAEVFDRLSPHPTFNELKARQDVYYGKNQVVPYAFDRTSEVGGHPALIFSEGQLNVVALSYFLGLAINAGDGALPFVVLDDTLAAMDVINVLGFADLCRRLREKKQLIVTTHDRRFAGLLTRKLTPREEGGSTVLVELDGWSEDGPVVRCERQAAAEILPLPGLSVSGEHSEGTAEAG